MNCERCEIKPATKKVVVAPKVDYSMAKKYMTCDACAAGMVDSLGHRFDRQVVVTNINQ